MFLPKASSAASSAPQLYTGGCPNPPRHASHGSLALSGVIPGPHRPTLPVWAEGFEIEDFSRRGLDLGVRARMESDRTGVRTTCDLRPPAGVLEGGDPLATPNGWRIPRADALAERVRRSWRSEPPTARLGSDAPHDDT